MSSKKLYHYYVGLLLNIKTYSNNFKLLKIKLDFILKG